MRVWLRRGTADSHSLFFSSLYPVLCLSSAEPDITHDAFCMSECRKEKEEREYYCYSEFGMYPVKDTETQFLQYNISDVWQFCSTFTHVTKNGNFAVYPKFNWSHLFLNPLLLISNILMAVMFFMSPKQPSMGLFMILTFCVKEYASLRWWWAVMASTRWVVSTWPQTASSSKFASLSWIRISAASLARISNWVSAAVKL